jgi:hypothetical protein
LLDLLKSSARSIFVFFISLTLLEPRSLVESPAFITYVALLPNSVAFGYKILPDSKVFLNIIAETVFRWLDSVGG